MKKESNLLLFDTHCHLSDPSYDDQEVLDSINIVSRKKEKFRILNVGCDLLTNIRTIEQSKKFFSFVYSAIGIHPNSNNDMNEENISWIESQANSGNVVAIGEIGLDYYRNFSDQNKQKIFFRKQVLIAKKYNLPVLLHLRNSKNENNANVFKDAISILKEVNWFKGVFHCFSSNYQTALDFLNLGFYISFSGNITFKNNKSIEETISKIPNERIVVESDSPYLSPEPLRGKKNYTHNIILCLKRISYIKNVSIFEISRITFFNSLRVLNIKS